MHLVECMEKKKYQVGNDIATHWYTYFLLFERLKTIKILYIGPVGACICFFVFVFVLVELW